MSELRALSVEWEKETGYDSIPTVEEYYRTETGSFLCCWPKCSFTRRDAEVMWRHVHTAHGGSLPEGA